jgi:sugar phosphate permease
MKMDDHAEPTGKWHYGWLILALGLLTVFCSLGLARFGYTMILPPMQDGLSLSDTQTGILATGNLVGYLGFALIGGLLASHFGPRRVISISLAIVGITMLLTGLAPGFLTALLCRTLTGMGSGGTNVPMMGLLVAWFAPKRRGLATGAAVAGSSLGLIATGSLVPILLRNFSQNGWRISWFVLGGITFVFAILAYWLLRDKPADKGLAPIGAVHGEGTASTDSPQGLHGWARIYRSPAIWHLSLIYAAFGFSYIIYATFFAKHLQSELAFSKEKAGNLWQLVGYISLICGLLWGWISDIIGRKYTLAIVCSLQACAYLLFSISDTYGMLLASAMIFGLTAWSIPAIMASACGDHFGSRLAPAALGFITLIFGIGQALGPFIAGCSADLTGSFKSAFLIAAGAALLGAIASLLLKQESTDAAH